MQVWILYADTAECRWVLGVYISRNLAKKAWKEYLEKRKEEWHDWYVSGNEKVAISEFKVIEDWNPEEIRDGL